MFRPRAPDRLWRVHRAPRTYIVAVRLYGDKRGSLFVPTPVRHGS
jgi:hypothetical protein